MGCRPMPSTGSEGVRWGANPCQQGFGGGSTGWRRIRKRIPSASSTDRRVEGTRLPAGFSFTSCLPGLCFTSCLPGSASPPACRGSASPPACRGSASPPASRGRRLDVADRRPIALRRLPDRPLVATKPARRTHACQRGTSYRSEKNPPLTRGAPAEAGPPGQSQPSHVHPVKQRAGAMRTRTGTRPSSTSCASPVPRIDE
jgi:hypothetical protein